MKTKTRKFIWSAPFVVATLAIVGALTAFGVLALPNADEAEAQAAPVPTNVAAEAADATGTDDITVTWGPTADNSAVTSFTVQYKKAADDTYVGAAGSVTITVGGGTNDAAARSAVIDGLDNGTAYNVRVRAVYSNPTRNSLWESPSPNSFTPKALPAAPASAPTVAAGTYGNMLSVSWTASATTSPAVTGYMVRYREVTTPVSNWMPSDDGMSVSTNSATLTGLTKSTQYEVEVASVNANGVGPWSATSTATSTSSKERPSDANFGGKVTDVDSTSGGAGVNITIEVNNLAENLPVGSSIVLYLEDDYQVPSSIPASAVQFSATGMHTGIDNISGNTDDRDADFTRGTVNADVSPTIKTGAYVTADKKDYAIRMYLPNFCTDGADCGPVKGQNLKVVLTSASGIKNPTEADTNSTYVDVLGPGDLLKSASTILAKTKVNFMTVAKIGLSKVDGKRGDELTVTGSGFNNGVSAAVHVLSEGPKPDNCGLLLANDKSARVGGGTVGSDDKVAVTFEVTVPTFRPGNVNWICMVDGEGRTSGTDVEDYKLKPSISVSPATANVGDTVTIFAEDFPNNATTHQWLKLAGQENTGNRFAATIGQISSTDGSASGTFVVPSFLEGTVKVESAWTNTGDAAAPVKADTKLTVIGSSLSVSKSEALPNELLTITGDGFGGANVAQAKITIDGVPLQIHDDSLNTNDMVDVSSAGQFVATVILWPAKGQSTNPTLDAGVHTIDVEDDAGFSGSVKVTIPAPTVMVTPEAAGPRDVVTISGDNWPVENLDGGDIKSITIDVIDGGRTRTYSVYADGAGRFFQEHQVHSGVTIPSTSRVEATYADEALVKLATYEVPEAIIDVTPGEGQPGDMITLSVDKMPVYAKVSKVEIASRDVTPVGNFSTDRTGSVTVDGVVIPGLDPGTYSVLMRVTDTVAIGSLEVLSEGPIGTEVPVADALADLGDSLEAVFYFDNVSKGWSFFDPQPEFAELNTLANLVNGEAYWVLVSEDVDDVVLNNKSRTLSCAGGDCWNLVIW